MLLGAEAHWMEMGTRPWSSWTSAHSRTALKDDGTLCSRTEPPIDTRTGPLLRTQTCEHRKHVLFPRRSPIHLGDRAAQRRNQQH